MNPYFHKIVFLVLLKSLAPCMSLGSMLGTIRELSTRRGASTMFHYVLIHSEKVIKF